MMVFELSCGEIAEAVMMIQVMNKVMIMNCTMLSARPQLRYRGC